MSTQTSSWPRLVGCCPFCRGKDQQPSCLERWGPNRMNSQERLLLSWFLLLDSCCLDPCLGPGRARATLEVSSPFRTDRLGYASGLISLFPETYGEYRTERKTTALQKPGCVCLSPSRTC